jgi:CTP:molybdopterin cytidylyltransferase MocA
MGRPKALLPLGNETFATRLINTFSTVCSSVLLVAGYHAAEIRAALPDHASNLIDNPDHVQGQLSSLRHGLAALNPSQIDAFFFHPVDCPTVRPETLHLLLTALQSQPQALLAIPRFDNRRGHPVLCRVALLPEFLSLAPTAKASDVVHNRVTETIYVDVSDPGILADIDDPQTYQRLLATHP